MKKLLLTTTAIALIGGSASAADLAPRPYVKAPAPAAVASWTGFYVFGGGGSGLWSADSNLVSDGTIGFFGPAGTPFTRDQRLGGRGWFGTVGLGYDFQFANRWVAGVFADGQFGDISGSMSDSFFGMEGREKLRTSYAAGARLGYLVAPNVLSYVNAGYTGSEWSGASLSTLSAFPGTSTAALATTSFFRRNGFFVGGGVENNLSLFGISAPGWFMKTEYRSAFYDRTTLAETCTAAGEAATVCGPAGSSLGTAITFKPWVQTISTSLVYRFNDKGMPATADASPRLYTKAPAAAAGPSWTGVYVFGGAGGGLWSAESNVETNAILGGPITPFTRDQRQGGSGWFGTVGLGYDWQFNGNWVAGAFTDGQFGDIHGSLNETFMANSEGTEKLRTSYAAGLRLGYLAAPNVLSYVNAGYTGSEWSGNTLSSLRLPGVAFYTTPSFHRDGWFVGGGVENSLDIFGIAAPGWFMKTEYRSAYYDRASLPMTLTPAFGGTPTGLSVTFKPWVQTVSTSLVYRFNAGSVVAKY
ncbi:outer membrane protein [Bradyrhizobium sp. RDM4]|uniref:outer membrane protein n=1 Tax=Bradyrhizobium sp. RDM4 TaxID=3378765 RepID=UPI0038FC2375